METTKEFKGTQDDWHLVDGINCKHIYRRPQSDLYEYNGNNGAGVASDRPLITIHKGCSGKDEQGYPFEKNAKLVLASKQLLEALQESNKDLIILHGNICAEIKAGRSRWEGVEEILRKRIQENKSAISSALGE